MNKRIAFLGGLLLICIAVWASITPTPFVRQFISRLNELGYDLQLRSRTLAHKIKPNNRIAIIDIDDKSLSAEGQWPWPREKLATLVDELKKQGASVIGFDMFFPEPQANISDQVLKVLGEKNLLTPDVENLLKAHLDLFDQDIVFANSLSQVETVLAIIFLESTLKSNILPPPILTLSNQKIRQLGIIKTRGYIASIPTIQTAAKHGGFINIYADNDGIFRHAPLLIEYEGNVYPSLPLQVILTYLGADVSLVTPKYDERKELEGIKIGNRKISTDANGEVYIPFIGRSYTFPYYSATDVLHHRLPANSLLGKILFVGTSATGLGDLQPTAIQTPFPGVEIQATMANGLLENNFSSIPAWTYGANLFLAVMLGLFATFTFPYLGPRTLAVLIIIFPIGTIYINNVIWEKTGLILSFLVPIILVLIIAIFNIIYGYLFETRKREHLKEMFGQYVPAKHIDEMLKTSGQFSMHGEDREMSVLFADIRSFTTISEGLAAASLVEMLNTFFTPMTEIIFKHHGTIDKYVGDLIMAFWGAPLKDKSHARHAIQSALEMQLKVKELKTSLAAHGWPEIKIGIGINSGNMSVGDMGSRFRRNYTVLGDNVNLASRVESLTKFYGADIMVTESTQQNQTKFIFRKLDRVRVKGKNKGIEIYDVLGLATDMTPSLQKELDLYHLALEDYFMQKWDASLEIMTQLREEHPHKKIYSLYIDRINEYKQNPPPADWDGVYTHHSK